MAIKKALVTGSSGLVGSESVKFLAEKGFKVYGIDNDMRGKMYGPHASTDIERKNLMKIYITFSIFKQI